MVFVQAASRPAGPAFACFEMLQTQSVELCLSPQILFEVGEVLVRPQLRQKFPLLTSERINTFLGEIQSIATMLPTPPKKFPLSRDPKDEPYINLAIAAGAAYLVTWNEKHLTYLMHGDTPEGKDFCRRFPGLKIVNPPVFLRETRSKVRATNPDATNSKTDPKRTPRPGNEGGE